MGNTVLQPKELLGVLLLKTTASRNKMLRMKWSYEGECFKIIEYLPLKENRQMIQTFHFFFPL